MGVSGQNTSLSIITFQFDPLNSTNGSTSAGAGFNPLGAMTLGMNPEMRRKCGEVDEASDLEVIGQPKVKKSSAPANKTGMPLSSDAYPCSTKDPKLAGYVNVTDPSCTFCDEVCQPPDVDDTIGFFDGFSGKTVGIVYGCLLAFSLLYQIWVCVYRDKKAHAELEELKNEVLYKSWEQGDPYGNSPQPRTGESTPAGQIQTKENSAANS